MRKSAGARDRLMSCGNLRWCVNIDISFCGESLNEVIEEFCELFLGVFISVAAKRFEKLGSELPALDERVEDWLFQRLE
jgi:hypothetical protein